MSINPATSPNNIAGTFRLFAPAKLDVDRIIARMSYSFSAHLARFGPQRRYHLPMTLSRARLYCERLARSHYENFTVASLLLPRQLLRHYYPVYAYCRWSDDLADETDNPSEALNLLRWWRSQLHGCYRGQATHPVMIALRETVARFQIPAQTFLDLLFAFEQDQTVGRYRTFDELLRYCQFSANPVGRLVLYLFECHDPQLFTLSDSICTGLQLANFWQDVSRDLDKGRIYLPEEDRRAFRYPEADLLAKRCTPAFRALMKFEVERARDLLYRGYPLIDEVPRAFAIDIELFIRGGLAILDRIERRDYDVLTSRPTVSQWRKGGLLLRGLAKRALFWT